MSIAQIQTSSLFELIPVKPAGREPASDAARAGTGEHGGGFEQTLQETDAPRSDRASDAGAARDNRGRSDGVEPRQSDVSEDTSPEAATEPDAAASSGETAQPDDQQDASPDQPDTEQQAATEEDAASAQAQVAEEQSSQVSQALAAQLAAASQGAAQPGASQAGTGESDDAEAQAAAKQAAAVAAANAAGQAQANATGQANTTQATTATTAVVQPLQQQDTQGESNQDSGRGGNTAGTQQAQTTANPATTNAGNASAGFTLADPSAGESRLPINSAANAQQASAALQVQQAGTGGQDDGDTLNTARITRGLANAVQQRGGAVTLRLTPPEMGTVRIQMNITGTNVSASFHAESASAQTLLTQQLAQLRTSLEGQGMSVERLTVQPLAATNAGQNAGQSQNDGQQQGQQQNAAHDGRSRGQYSGDTPGDGRSDSGNNDPDSQAQQNQRRGFFDQLGDAAEQPAA